MKKLWSPALLGVPLLLLSLAVFVLGCEDEPERQDRYDAVIYGGGPQAVAAALQFGAVTRQQSSVLLIVPERALGSVLTIGKQNLFDVNYYESRSLPKGIAPGYQSAQAGSLYAFLRDMSSVFPPSRMENYLEQRLRSQKRVTIRFEHDITNVEAVSDEAGGGFQIRSVTYRRLAKDAEGHYIFDPASPKETVTARVFLDASETGRLVRMSGQHVGTVGREDQNPDRLQMAATLMFKVKGVDSKALTQNGTVGGQAMSPKGSFQFWGGYEVSTNPLFVAYGQSDHRFRIKPFNAGEDGYADSWESASLDFWMNMLLIYDVDARKTKRDVQPLEADAGPGLDPETARDMALAEIAKPAFVELLRKLPGFGNAELVRDVNGKPEAGEMLYVRESIHTADYADPATRTYRFALDRQGVSGGDAKYYARRIGLGYYQFDSNSYKKGEQLSNPMGNEPWYVPYETLLEPKLTNVLVPGYAANIDSFAWTAMRVYPNLIMLGDAAGTAAGLAVKGEFTLHRPTDKQMALLQNRLREADAILEK